MDYENFVKDEKIQSKGKVSKIVALSLRGGLESRRGNPKINAFEEALE